MRSGYVFRFAALLACSLLLAIDPAFADRGPGSHKIVPPGAASTSPAGVSGLSVNYATVAQVIQCLVGPGVMVTNPVVTGSAVSLGSFTGGTGIIGFESGIVLSTGDVTSVVGPNQFDNTSTQTGTPGDPVLSTLAGQPTFDATTLEFDFDCDEATQFSIEYVFASEEYNEYVHSIYNDVFAFFLDGNTVADNIAVVPAFCGDAPGQQVTINTVHCDNPYPGPGLNCGCYRNNDLQDGGGAINTEMDGLTVVFARTVSIPAGSHHLKIAIADASDRVWDSNVFLRCQSLVCAESTPAQRGTWGRLKVLYR